MNTSRLAATALGGILTVSALTGTVSIAKADTASTAAIVAGAAAIVGALVYDGNNRPYYVRDNRRYYVTQQEAQYYRGHNRGYERRAYVPEQRYPVARDPYHGGNNGMNNHGDNMGHDHR